MVGLVGGQILQNGVLGRVEVGVCGAARRSIADHHRVVVVVEAALTATTGNRPCSSPIVRPPRASSWEVLIVSPYRTSTSTGRFISGASSLAVGFEENSTQ